LAIWHYVFERVHTEMICAFLIEGDTITR